MHFLCFGRLLWHLFMYISSWQHNKENLSFLYFRWSMFTWGGWWPARGLYIKSVSARRGARLGDWCQGGWKSCHNSFQWNCRVIEPFFVCWTGYNRRTKLRRICSILVSQRASMLSRCRKEYWWGGYVRVGTRRGVDACFRAHQWEKERWKEQLELSKEKKVGLAFIPSWSEIWLQGWLLHHLHTPPATHKNLRRGKRRKTEFLLEVLKG